MAIHQLLFLQLRFDIYSVLNLKKLLIFPCGLICAFTDLVQPAAFDGFGH